MENYSFQILLGGCHSTWEKSTRVELPSRFQYLSKLLAFSPKLRRIYSGERKPSMADRVKKNLCMFLRFFPSGFFYKIFTVTSTDALLVVKKKVLLNVKFAFWEVE